MRVERVESEEERNKCEVEEEENDGWPLTVRVDDDEESGVCVAKCDVKEEDEEEHWSSAPPRSKCSVPERDARAKCVVLDEEEEDGWPVAGVGSEDEDG